MVDYHILIVADKIETRKKLCLLLDSLALNIRKVSVPSGEEAILELRTTRFDLLVTDYSLPGIDGYELLNKAKKRHPGLHGILIVRENQEKFPLSSDNHNVDVYLRESLEPPDFLNAVERCLGNGGAGIPFSEEPEDSIESLESVSNRLARLRQALTATTALLLDNSGSILVCSGNFPEEIDDGLLMRPVVDSFCDGMKIAKSLRAGSPFTLQFFNGPKHDLFLAQVGQVNALLVIMDTINLNHELGRIVHTLNEGVDDLRQILMRLGIDKLQSNDRAEEVSENEAFIDEAELMAEAPRIEALLQQSKSNLPKTEELNAFWHSIVEEETTNEISKADMLTYEQAIQLGLAPEE